MTDAYDPNDGVGRNNPLPVILAGGDTASASMTRPADTTAYASGDLIANSTTAGSVVPLALVAFKAAGAIVKAARVRIRASSIGWKAAVVRAHFFRSLPVPSVGDNAAFNNAETYACTESDYLGYADVTLTQYFSSAPVFAKGFATITGIFRAGTGSSTLYCLLEARGAITPASADTFSVTLELDQG